MFVRGQHARRVEGAVCGVGGGAIAQPVHPLSELCAEQLGVDFMAQKPVAKEPAGDAAGPARAGEASSRLRNVFLEAIHGVGVPVVLMDWGVLIKFIPPWDPILV